MALSNLFCRAYACGAIRSNDASTEELSYELGALSAEVAGGGVRINIIPKVGGNIFSGSVFGNIAPEALTHSNFSQRLKDLGLQAPNRVSRIWDTSAAIGGPIVRDTLWFFQANRYWGTDKLVADAFWEIDPTDAVYEPDLNRQAVNDQWNLSNNLRLTYQVNLKNRVAVYFDSQRLCMCHFLVSQGLAPEATERWRLPVNYHGTATWTAPLSNRLLLEAGFSATFQDLSRESQPLPSSRNQFGFREQSTGVRFRAPRGPLSRNISFLRAYKTSLSYVTGSHVFKVGVTLNEGSYRSNKWANLDAEGAFLFRGTPFRLLVLSTPYEELERLNAELGLYVQDSWTLERWTLNLGPASITSTRRCRRRTLPGGRG